MPETIPCPACGTENPTDAAQCQVCDYELRMRAAQAPGAPRKCPRCGSHLPGAATFCQICGQSVDRRLPRPVTASLNVRALFGDQSDAPRRMPIRERTEFAPAAGHPQLQPFVMPEPVRPEVPIENDSSPVPRGRRRPAPRPRPAYSGFDPADSGTGQPPPKPSPALAAAKANPAITVFGDRSAF
ncbi:MAG: zinc ribbon domain-containing protein, partial [Myxococcales bacterium]|nr:zinc ribbon domain-containing protein [Myxococcales bacterium]